MTITREEMVKRLSERSGYYQKDVRALLQCMDDVVFDALCEATLEDEVQIQAFQFHTGGQFQVFRVSDLQRTYHP